MPTATVTLTIDELRAIVREEVRAEAEPLRMHIHRLSGIVNSRLALPVESLTVREAATRMKCCEKTIRRALAKRIFTDVRAGKTNGSDWKILSDEFDVYRLEGEDALAAFRRLNGRD